MQVDWTQEAKGDVEDLCAFALMSGGLGFSDRLYDAFMEAGKSLTDLKTRGLKDTTIRGVVAYRIPLEKAFKDYGIAYEINGNTVLILRAFTTKRP